MTFAKNDAQVCDLMLQFACSLQASLEEFVSKKTTAAPCAPRSRECFSVFPKLRDEEYA